MTCKASKNEIMRRSGERHKKGEPLSYAVLDETLKAIRARRDEMGFGYAVAEFFDLFDDGAEFGPDVKEPEYTLRYEKDGRVTMFLDGSVVASVQEKVFDAIKKLGAEEAKGE